MSPLRVARGESNDAVGTENSEIVENWIDNQCFDRDEGRSIGAGAVVLRKRKREKKRARLSAIFVYCCHIPEKNDM